MHSHKGRLLGGEVPRQPQAESLRKKDNLVPFLFYKGYNKKIGEKQWLR